MMTPASLLNTLLCLAALLAMLADHAAEGAALFTLVSVAACAAAWHLGRRGGGGIAPGWAISALVIAALLWAGRGLLLRTGQPLVTDLTQFLILILGIKLFDRKGPRDEAQVLSLSLFVAIGAVLSSNSLPVGLLLLLYVPAALGAAIVWHLRAGEAMAAEHAAASLSRVGAPAPLGARDGPAVGRREGSHLRRTISVAALQTIALSILAFIATPRGLGQDLLGGFGKLGRGASVGFTDQVRLGRSGRLGVSPTPVLDLTVRDQEGANIGSSTRAWYLRGAVKNSYENGSWFYHTESEGRQGSRHGLMVEPGETLELAPPGRATVTYDQTVTVRGRPPDRSYLFASWRPLALTSDRPITLEPVRAEGVLRRHADDDPLAYTIRCAADFVEDVPSHTPPSAAFDSGPVRELVDRLLVERGLNPDPAVRSDADNRAAATLFMRYLRENLAYSLDMIKPEPGEDPIEMFLLRTKRGHCEYFASALVAMCQSAGLEARLITGFLASEFNPIAAQYVVRQAHAHAWAEVSVSPGRWIVLDPSPPGDIERLHAQPAGMLSRIRQFYEAIEVRWVNTIVLFDTQRRSSMFGEADRSAGGGLFRAIGDAARAVGALVSSVFESRESAGIVLRLLAAFLVLVVLVAAIARAVIRARHRGGRGAPDAELASLLADASFYPRLLRALGRLGLEKPVWTPPLAHADAISRRNAVAGDALREAASLFYRVRFARTPLTPEERERAEATVERVRTGSASRKER